MNITPVNNYNNKVSFRHLLPGKNIIGSEKPLKKIFKNPEIKKLVEHYHKKGIDITLSSDFEGKYFTFSIPIEDYKIISGKVSIGTTGPGKYAILRININRLGNFKAEKAIEKLDNDYNKKFNRFVREHKEFSMFDEFNREFK